MADKEEFISLEKALSELRLREDDLKRLVSEGEIRAFRDADKMKFKREDIEKLKQDTGKTIQFQDESSDTLTDDLLFDEEIEDLDIDDGEIGMATAPISSEETFIEDKPSKKGKKGKGKGRNKTSSARPVSKTKVTRAVPEAAAAAAGAAAGGRTTTLRRTTGRSTQILQRAEEQKGEISALWAATLVLTSIIMIYAGAVWWDIATNQQSSFTKGIAEKASEMLSKN
ncbi:MAG: hypothetical protein V3W41_19950 [Planctomycetota bacterium]